MAEMAWISGVGLNLPAVRASRQAVLHRGQAGAYEEKEPFLVDGCSRWLHQG